MTSQAISQIQNNFLSRLKNQDQKFDIEEAKAMTAIYLCVAFNPQRNKMVSKELLNYLGLSISSPYKHENTVSLGELINELKDDAHETRINILKHIGLALTQKVVAGKITLCPKALNFLQQEPFKLNENDLTSLVNVCGQGITSLQEKNHRFVHAAKASINSGVVIGGIGGFFAASALPFEAMVTAVGLGLTITAIGGIVAGAMIVAAIATALLIYAAYRLIDNAKRDQEYDTAAIKQDTPESLDHSVKGFMYEWNPEGDLPKLNQTLSLSK